MKKKVLFLLPYPLHKAPSQRFRVECYFNLLSENNIEFDCQSFLDAEAWKILYEGGSIIKKTMAVFKGFMRRTWKVLGASQKYDYVFVHREAAPLGPPIFEWALAKLFGKKLIYDFDDAIWIPNVTQSNRLARSIKCFWKVSYICKWAHKISAGNTYLANYAKQFNKAAAYNPTCVDMKNKYTLVKDQQAEVVCVGWTGSHSTVKYLDLIYPVLKEIEREVSFRFLVICDQPPKFHLDSLRFIKWQEASEIEDLLKIHIGVMPLPEDEWSEGKCGFKLIQYLSLGIPAVASPVGVNKDIIEHEVNGFLCSSEQEWKAALLMLIDQEQLRIRMGTAGGMKIQKEYSVQANASNFLSLFS